MEPRASNHPIYFGKCIWKLFRYGNEWCKLLHDLSSDNGNREPIAYSNDYTLWANHFLPGRISYFELQSRLTIPLEPRCHDSPNPGGKHLRKLYGYCY